MSPRAGVLALAALGVAAQGPGTVATSGPVPVATPGSGQGPWFRDVTAASLPGVTTTTGSPAKDYISEVNGHALAPAVAQPPHSFDSVHKLFEQVYAHEQKVTASIHELISLSYKDNDHTTLNFLQWYVTEQREEEALMRNILDRLKLIGDGPMSLYYIDKEIEKINKAELAAEAAEGAAQ